MSFNYRAIIKVAGVVMTIMGIAMLFPLLVSFYYGEINMAKAFVFTAVPCLIFGFLILTLQKTDQQSLKIRDGFLIVAICWLMASAIGALPYLISGTLSSFIDAFFESTSGFTTTGISVIENVAALPKGLLFWRSFSIWLGGMGILIFAISILPALGISGQKIANAETPSPTIQKISTRMSDSAKYLYVMYISFTVLAVILLKFGGLSLFDTIMRAFSSMGTGGVSTYTLGANYTDSFYVESIVTIFGLLSSINFVLYSYLIKGHWKNFFHNTELRAFFIILAAISVLIALNLWTSETYSSIGASLRHSFFQTSAFMSTAGYYTSNYTLWPAFSQTLLFILLFIGGCSASTCGSIKVIRVLIFFKIIIRGILKKLHPFAVVPIKLSGQTITSARISSITNFLLLYFAVFILTSVVISIDNFDFVTTLSASAAALSNTGMGMGLVGPSGSFTIFSPFVRLWLSFVMLAGRLELFTIVLLFTPAFWNPGARIKI